MSKKLLFKVLACLLFVGVAVVWLLSKMMPDKFANFEPMWLLAIFCAAMGALFIIKGLFGKNVSAGKKFNIFVGAGFLVGALFAVAGSLVDNDYVLPIIAIIVTVAVLLSILAVGGKKWDDGDNQKVGYKNYYQRKAEEEKAAKKAEKD